MGKHHKNRKNKTRVSGSVEPESGNTTTLVNTHIDSTTILSSSSSTTKQSSTKTSANGSESQENPNSIVNYNSNDFESISRNNQNDEVGLEKIEKSRNVFISTACQLCKNVVANISSSTEQSNPKDLLWCGGCRMVKYCSRQHQTSDWKTHKHLCRLVQQFLQSHHKRYLYEEASTSMNETKWLQMRYDFMQLFRDQMGRELLAFEKEMLLFPNVCFICRQVASDDLSLASTQLKTCQKCFAASFCSKHFQKDQDHHCQELKVWMDIVRWENEHGLVKPDMSKVVAKDDATIVLNHFPSTIQNYFLHNSTSILNVKAIADAGSGRGKKDENADKTDNDNYKVLLARLTDIVTVPLSIAWALSKLLFHQSLQIAKNWTVDVITTFTIHLIGAESEFEGCCPHKWESYFLHLFPKLRQLNIVLIGPELLKSESEDLSLCSVCTKEGCKIHLEYHNQFYHDYCNQPSFLEPDIICAFNCGLYRTTGYGATNNEEHSWKPTLLRLTVNSSSSAPAFILITEYTKTEINQDSAKVQSECKNLYEVPELCCRNPYRSLRPQRTLINENIQPLMFKNNFITVFGMK